MASDELFECIDFSLCEDDPPQESEPDRATHDPYPREIPADILEPNLEPGQQNAASRSFESRRELVQTNCLDDGQITAQGPSPPKSIDVSYAPFPDQENDEFGLNLASDSEATNHSRQILSNRTECFPTLPPSQDGTPLINYDATSGIMLYDKTRDTTGPIDRVNQHSAMVTEYTEKYETRIEDHYETTASRSPGNRRIEEEYETAASQSLTHPSWQQSQGSPVDGGLSLLLYQKVVRVTGDALQGLNDRAMISRSESGTSTGPVLRWTGGLNSIHETTSISDVSGTQSSLSRAFNPSAISSQTSIADSRSANEGNKRRKSSKGRLYCTYCWKSWTKTYEWKRHERTHIPDDIWVCDVDSWLSDAEMENYLKITCSTCQEYLRRPGLKPGSRPEYQRSADCTGHMFFTKPHYTQHVEGLHGITPEHAKFHANQAGIAVPIVIRGPIFCGFCLEILPTRTDHIKHTKAHFEGIPESSSFWRLANGWDTPDAQHFGDCLLHALVGQPISTIHRDNYQHPRASRSLAELILKAIDVNEHLRSGSSRVPLGPHADRSMPITHGVLAQMGAFYAAIDVARNLPGDGWNYFYVRLLPYLTRLLAACVMHERTRDE